MTWELVVEPLRKVGLMIEDYRQPEMRWSNGLEKWWSMEYHPTQDFGRASTRGLAAVEPKKTAHSSLTY